MKKILTLAFAVLLTAVTFGQNTQDGKFATQVQEEGPNCPTKCEVTPYVAAGLSIGRRSGVLCMIWGFAGRNYGTGRGVQNVSRG